MGWPRGDPNGQWWGYDLPLRRDPLFWIAVATCLGIGIWRPVGYGEVLGSLVVIVLGPALYGVVPVSVRNFWRGLRSERDSSSAESASSADR